jgi:hypothetical protein
VRFSTELPSRVAHWPKDWGEAYEERAAIMEYEGGLDREEAERNAERLVRAEYAKHSFELFGF